jgi:gluconokinase
MVKTIVLMGVSGCGKTSVGREVGARLGRTFYDGDDFHEPENVEKMRQGIPLNDDDRRTWLAALHDLIADNLQLGIPIVLACSTLKKVYRQQLREGNEGLTFVFLKGDYELIWSRMGGREGHYMKPEMLRSQFDTLEIPENAIEVDIDQAVSEIVDEIILKLDY